jgi:hypothetical protein
MQNSDRSILCIFDIYMQNMTKNMQNNMQNMQTIWQKICNPVFNMQNSDRFIFCIFCIYIHPPLCWCPSPSRRKWPSSLVHLWPSRIPGTSRPVPAGSASTTSCYDVYFSCYISSSYYITTDYYFFSYVTIILLLLYSGWLFFPSLFFLITSAWGFHIPLALAIFRSWQTPILVLCAEQWLISVQESLCQQSFASGILTTWT